MLRFEVLQGQYGDCFILRWDAGNGPKLAVIDGGPDGVYKASLRPRLMALKGGQPQLVIDWAMVSHIDDDHINGMVRMMSELRDAQDQHAAPFRVRRFWFNSFEDLTDAHGVHAASAQAAVASIGEALPAGKDPESQAVLASVPQGRNLRDALDALNIGDNAPVGGFLQSGAAPVDIDGLTAIVVGPLQQQLDDLRKDWAKAPKARTAEAASYADISVTNLSSLVCLVTLDTGGPRKILLTGDARGDYILTGLEAAGALPAGGKLELDLLKVQHHGSDRDVVQDYFARLPAKHYVISANGKYSNPDPDTLKWLIQARGADAYTIHLSNEQPWMAAFFAGLKAGRNFVTQYRGALDDVSSVDEINLD